MPLQENELLNHPQGQITLSGGQMRDATMGRFSWVNNAKLKHTLAKSPNGYVVGPREGSGTIEIDVSENGPERTYLKFVTDANRLTAQFEIPLMNTEIEMVFNSFEGELAIGESVKITMGWIGTVKPPVI